MYNGFESLEAARTSAQRIFDPFSYRVTSTERLVPICPSEAPALAERWPVLWVRDVSGEFDLVVLRGLQPGAEVPGLHSQSRTSLPLLLQAYPFRYRDLASGGEIGLDRSAPMRERDAGAYIFDDRGGFPPGTDLKLRALDLWGEEIGLRASLTAELFHHGLVEPVRLPGTLQERLDLPDMFSALAFPEDAPIFRAIPSSHWLTVARFLAAQRMSLYMMSRLVAALPEGTA